jgi:hypothetical protein
VRVGDDDLLYPEIVFGNQRENFLDVISRVDHQRFACRLVSQDRAVALQGADGKNFMDHRCPVVLDFSTLEKSGPLAIIFAVAL